MGFVWFSVYTAIISSNGINKFIFVMVKCSVFFAVRTEFLNIIQTSFSFKELRRPSTEFTVCFHNLSQQIVYYVVQEAGVNEWSGNRRPEPFYLHWHALTWKLLTTETFLRLITKQNHRKVHTVNRESLP
jgi:hypothetical protein